MIGLLHTGSSGLGWLAVIGRSRVPSPPAITTAFTGSGPPSPLSGRDSHRPPRPFRPADRPSGSNPVVRTQRLQPRGYSNRPSIMTGGSQPANAAAWLAIRLSRFGHLTATGGEPPGLDQVHRGRAPVQRGAPDYERPADHLRHLGGVPGVRAQQEQRE